MLEYCQLREKYTQILQEVLPVFLSSSVSFFETYNTA